MEKEVAELEAWLRELNGQSGETAGWTTAEIAQKTGKTIRRVRRMLREAIRAGTWEHVGKRRAYRINGQPYRVDVYRPVAELPAKTTARRRRRTR